MALSHFSCRKEIDLFFMNTSELVRLGFPGEANQLFPRGNLSDAQRRTVQDLAMILPGEIVVCNGMSFRSAHLSRSEKEIREPRSLVASSDANVRFSHSLAESGFTVNQPITVRADLP